MGGTESLGKSAKAWRQLPRRGESLFDPLARIFPDEQHSGDEPREIIIGHSAPTKLLLVAFIEYAQGVVRIISARRATKREIMRNTSRTKSKRTKQEDLLPEYRFDYATAKPNRFAKPSRNGAVAVLLDPDVAKFFRDAKSINAVLRAVMTAIPRRRSA